MSPRKRKIPTKAELLQLQKLYKTDEKIGERLGGVPAYLIAYWRRKKGVPKHSLPKFSEKEIRDLWERYGDDDRCGLELGISKAAFYNWRRRYGIKEKPAFLKLEQLEFNFPGLRASSTQTSLYNKQTITQKILAQLAEKGRVEVGEEVEVEPNAVISHMDTGAIIKAFKQTSSELVWNPNKIIISLSFCRKLRDGRGPDVNRAIRDFVKRQGIKGIVDIGEGICHQVAIERGQIHPGHLVLGTDPYTLSYGCLSAVGMHIESEEMADVWSRGVAKLTVPRTIRVDISGRRPRGVYGKDIALSVIKQLASIDVAGKVIEFYGNVVTQMSISERFTLTNLSLDAGARAAVCPFDSVTRRYLTGRAMENYRPVIADKNAVYTEMYQVNIDHLTPQLFNPNSKESIRSVVEHEGLPVTTIVIGTSNNGRFDDLRVAAEILKGKRIHRDVRLLVYPTSRSVYLEALKKGLIRVLAESGGIILFPGLSVSPNGIEDMIASGERALVTSNSGVFGGIDVSKTEILLCSPATAAASSLNGTVTDPSRYVK